MGNHHSIEAVPRPTRPPRPSTTDLPDLPGLPIYKTFRGATEIKPGPATTLSDEPPPPFQEQQPSESVTAWVLAQSDSTPVPTSTSRPSHQERRTHSSVRSTGRHEAGLDRPPVSQRPPQYDRASRLAESYQSLLPDFDSLDYRESHTALRRQKSDLRHGGSNREQWRYKHNPRNSGRFSPPPQVHTLRHTSPRPGIAPGPAIGSWQPASGFDMTGYPPRAGTHGLGASGDAHSILTDSSATAVESDVSPVDSRFSNGSEMVFPTHGARQQAQMKTTDAWDPNPSIRPHESYNTGKRTVTTTTSMDNLNVNNNNRFTSFENAGSSTSDKDTTGDEDLKGTASGKRERKPGGRITSSDYVGLQICSELLTDELLKTFFRRHPTEKHAKASKLQALLLIEAYEAMLDNCRKELLHVPLPERSAGDGERADEREGLQRRRHIRDAVRILDHWLDSLYVIYDDTFGDLPGGGDEQEQAGLEEVSSTVTVKGQDGIVKESTVPGGQGDNVPGTNNIGPLPAAAQVPVQPGPTTGSSRLLRGWNRGVGF
ncbi:hypothetical protein V8F06_010248 [Rhypophila decipiens]